MKAQIAIVLAASHCFTFGVKPKPRKIAFLSNEARLITVHNHTVNQVSTVISSDR